MKIFNFHPLIIPSSVLYFSLFLFLFVVYSTVTVCLCVGVSGGRGAVRGGGVFWAWLCGVFFCLLLPWSGGR